MASNKRSPDTCDAGIVVSVNSETPSNTAKIVFTWLGRTFIAGCVLLGFLWLLSPRCNSRMEEWTTSVQTVPAAVDHCELIRNGDTREHQVRCGFAYNFEGKQYSSRSTAWSSDSPFVTSGSLEDALAMQSYIKVRPAHVHHYAPDHATFVDNRWIVAPSLGTILGLLFIACMGCYIASIPTVYRRSELNDAGEWTHSGRRQIVQLALLSCAAIICLYALTNRPANAMDRIGLSKLQQVPAHLTDCTHRFHGLSKGHDEINCGFEYMLQGKTYTGRAEGVEFRLIPTAARMDAEVKRMQQVPDRVAYVDPLHPTYALAYINNDWLVPYSWGLLEGTVAAILFLLIPILIKETISSHA